jgi:SAM-dependent methyltransferase
MQPSDRVSDLYADMYAHGAERARRDAGALDKADNIVAIWQLAKLPAMPRVVEIGCGEGAVAASLMNRGFAGTYTGFDVSTSGVAEAQERNVDGATFQVSSGSGVPMGDDSADVVVLCHVVEHVEYPRALIYEACRIAPYVVVEVPLELNARLPRDYVWDDLGHINKYTATSIRQLVQTCDLEVVEQFSTNPSQGQALFGNRSRKRRLEWQIKQRGLALAPAVARSLFTYHETLLARRPEQARVA